MTEQCEVCRGCRRSGCAGECERTRCKCTATIMRREFWAESLPTLAANLGVAAGLCESFQRGYMSCACGDLVDNAEWQPGCGRPL